MRILGVIDLAAGRAVHAVGGQRQTYAPIAPHADGPAFDTGDASTLAAAYRRLGVGTLYVADLDAIGGGRTQEACLRSIADAGVPLWVDAGVNGGDDAAALLAAGAARVIVGLETLRSEAALCGVLDRIGPDRTVLSLDLRDGRPLARHDGGAFGGDDPAAIAARAQALGVRTILVLDVARVGRRTGPDLALLTRVRQAAPAVAVLAGGGVRGAGDLAALEQAGCEGAAVATALVDGRLTAADLAHHVSR